MIVQVLLDPGLLAFSNNINTDALSKKILGLAFWSQAIRSHSWLKLYSTSDLLGTLEQSGFIPAYGPIAEALGACNLSHVFRPEDVLRPLHSLLERCCVSFCCVKDEAHSNFVATPSLPWHMDSAVDALTQQALVLAHIEKHIHSSGPILLGSSLAVDYIEFSALLELIDSRSSTVDALISVPTQISDSAINIREIESALGHLQSQEVWGNAVSNADLKLAIALRCREKLISTGSYTAWSDIPNFYVGADFINSVGLWEAAGRGRFANATLEACAAAVLQEPTLKWKAFRKAKRKDDGAAPLRAHISKGGVALRLMAWRRPAGNEGNNIIEFANVGGKAEEEISYVPPDAAV